MKGKNYIAFSQRHPTFYLVGKFNSAVGVYDPLTQRRVSILSVIYTVIRGSSRD